MNTAILYCLTAGGWAKTIHRIKDRKAQMLLSLAFLLTVPPVFAQETEVRFEVEVSASPFSRLDTDDLGDNFGFTSIGPSPAFADIDGDGDQDLVVGEPEGRIVFVRNDGDEAIITCNTPAIFCGGRPQNPIASIDVGENPQIAFWDANNDEKPDLFLGSSNGKIAYFRNDTPEGGTIVFTEVTGADNPLALVDEGAGTLVIPAFVDTDGNGMKDVVFVGTARAVTGADSDGQDSTYTEAGILYFRLDGTSFQRDNDSNPFNGESFNLKEQIGVAPPYIKSLDFDGDGDDDLVIFLQPQDEFLTNTELRYYQNDNGNFTLKESSAFTRIPLEFENTILHPNPAFADLDGDTDFDMILGYIDFKGDAQLKLFPNVGTPESPRIGNGLLRGNAPAFYHPGVDEDELPDLILGLQQVVDTLTYLDITENGSFVEINNSPFAGIRISQAADNPRLVPVVVDIDNDGDEDVVVGGVRSSQNLDEQLALLRNDNGSFTLLSGTDSPFNGFELDLSQGSIANQAQTTLYPAFYDPDEDGLPDLVLGANDGKLRYYPSTGTASFDFSNVEGAATHPFTGLVGADTTVAPTFADIDRDGDQDLFLGLTPNALQGESQPGIIKFFRNDNNVFTEVTGADNLFAGLQPGIAVTPTFADGDGDGDLDLYVGAQAPASSGGGNLGVIYQYRNLSPPSVTTGIFETPRGTFRIHPNPTQEEVHITLENIAPAPYQVSVFDLNGKLIYSEKGENFGQDEVLKVRVNQFQTGMYVIRLTVGNQVIAERMVIH